MSRTEELIQRCQMGDEIAKEILVQENVGLIWSVVRRFAGRGVESEDLFQLGCLGFLKAIDGFDLEYGTQFSTYAVPKIAGEIRRYLRDDGAVKVSRTIKEQACNIKAARLRLTNILGREPSILEISSQIGLGPEEIAFAEMATTSTESIYAKAGEDGLSLEHILSDTESEADMVEKISLKQAVEKLNPKEAQVIKLRYYHALTQEKASKLLAVSQVQISRIEKRAIAHLREMME